MDSAMHVLVLSNPEAKHLHTLEPLKSAAHFTTGTDPEMLRETAPLADVILNGMFTGDLLRVDVSTRCQGAVGAHAVGRGGACAVPGDRA